MLQLRKILLSNKLYFIIGLITIIITSLRLLLPKESMYQETDNKVEGIITKIEKKEEYTRLYIKKKEIVIVSLSNIPKNLELGDQVIVYGMLEKPSKNTTKYLFNYENYCKNNHIFYLMKGKQLIIKKKNKNIFYKVKNKVKNRVGNNPYLNTLLLGDKSYLKEEIKQSYQENGVSHLFAISGMHIALLAKIIEVILKRKKLQEESIFKITSFICIFYLCLVGFSPSILRGVLFYIGFSINRIYYFYIKPRNLFILLLSISLIVNPNYLLDTGFQYSYLISFSLIECASKLQGKNYLVSLFKVSCLSFLVSIPITSYYFYQINLFSILYNLFFVPFVSIIIFPFSLIVFLIKPLEPIYIFFTNFLENTSIFLSHISFGKILFKRLPLFYYGIEGFLLLLSLIKKKKIYQIIYLCLILFHIIISYIPSRDYIEFLDVGQGDSTYLKLSGKNILIDTGGKTKKGDIYTNILKPYFKSRGIYKIHFLILTHGDKDHMGDALSIIKDYKVEHVILNCGEHNFLEKELIKELKKKKIKYASCIEEIELKNNTLYFFNTNLYDNENDNSNVIYTELNQYHFLLMGDASIATEKEIIKKYNLPNIDVLKVGHHGSNTSSGKEFINEINPKYSIISVGKNNRYRHPNKEVLENLKDSKIVRTDQKGSILFTIKNNKLKIETCLP